jgi:hypothetical protein
VAKGGFWTANTGFEPKAQFRFKVEIDGLEFEDAPGTVGESNQGDYANDQRSDTSTAWYAKSVDKPGIEILSNVEEGNYFNLGAANSEIDINLSQPKLKPITMTLVDPTYPNVTRKLLRWIRRTGYNDSQVAAALNTINRSAQDALLKTIGHVRIYQLDNTARSARGAELARLRELGFEPNEDLSLEVWTLYNAYPSTIDFGKLDYSSSDLVEIQITWVYSNFTCEMIKLPDGTGDIEQAFTYFKDFADFGGVDISKKPTISRNNCKDRMKDANNVYQSLQEWARDTITDTSDPCYPLTFDTDDQGRIIVSSEEERQALIAAGRNRADIILAGQTGD